MDDSQEIIAGLAAWAVIAFLLAAGLAWWFFLAGRHRPLLGKPRQRAVPWDASHVFAIGLLSLGMPLLVHLVLRDLGLLAWFAGPADAELASIRSGLWSAALALPLQAAAILAFLHFSSGALPYQLGLTAHRALANVVLGVLAWLLLVPVVFLVHVVVSLAFERLMGTPPEDHSVTLLARQAHVLDWVIIILTSLVCAPFLEELLFRGVLQQWLVRSRIGKELTLAVIVALECAAAPGLGAAQAAQLLAWLTAAIAAYLLLGLWRRPVAGAIYVSALAFASGHPWPTPIPLLILGVGLGWLFQRTQSLAAPITLHFLFNLVAVLSMAALHVAPSDGKDGIGRGGTPASVRDGSLGPGAETRP